MADGTIKTVLEISGEGSYRNKLKEIGQALKGVGSEQKMLDAEFGKSNTSMGKLVQQHKLLENRLKLQKDRLEAVRQEYERVVEAEGKNSTSARRLQIEYNNTRASIMTTEKSIKELSDQIEKNGTKWGKLTTWVEQNEAKLQKWGDTASRVAGKINKALTAATTAVVGYSAKAFMDFEDQMAIVGTIADETEVSLADLGDQALAASDATGQAATEIAAATYQAISAGAGTAHAVDLVEKSAKGAKAGLSDTTTVVDGLTTAMNAWKISYDQSETVLDKMITTQNVGKTTLGDLANNMGKVTAFAPQVGVSLDEVLAATAALTKNGYGTESAMTALKNVMSAVIKPTSQAKEAAKAMGLEFDAAALRSKGLVGFLQDVISKTKGDEAALASLFGSVEGLGGVMLLAGGAAGDFSDALGQIRSSAGALNEAFDKRTSSRAEQMAMALNRLKNAAISFGQTLAPYIDMAAGAIEKLADKLGSMSEEEQKTLLETAKWAIILTKFVQIGGKVVANLGNITKGIEGIGKAGSLLGKGGKFASLLAGGGGAMLGAAAGVAGLTAAMVIATKKMDEFAESYNGANTVKKAFADLSIDTEKVDALKSTAEEVRQAIQGLYDQEYTFNTDTNNFFDEYIAWLTDGLPETEEQVEYYKQQAENLIKVPMDAIEAEYRRRKGELDTLLAQGVLSPEAYQTELDKLNKETEAAKGEIQTLADEFDNFTDGAVAQNAALNEEQIGYLDGLREQITTLTGEILESTSAVLQAAELSKKRVQQGDGTAEDVVVATAARETEYQVSKQQRDEALNALEYSKRVEIEMEVDPTKKADLEEKLKETLENARTVEAEELAGMTEDINAYWDSWMTSFPDLSEGISEVVDKAGMVEEIQQAINEGLDPDTFVALMKKLGKEGEFNLTDVLWEQGGETIFQAGAAGDQLTRWATELQQEMHDAIAGLDQSQLADMLAPFMAAVESGALEELDFSSLGDGISAMLTMIDLSDDGKTIGMGIPAGTAQGVREGAPEAVNAVNGATLEMINNVKTALDERSPSKVFADIGLNMMLGLRNGIANNRRAVSAALTQLGSLLRNAGRQSMQGWINGVNGMRGALVSAYSAAARAAAAAARAELQIKSPSRVFARIGEYTAEGMIAGVNARAGAVRRSIEDMVDPPQPRRRGGSPALAGAGGETTVNNYTTYNVPYSGIYGSREARRLSQALARAENARKKGRGA